MPCRACRVRNNLKLIVSGPKGFEPSALATFITPIQRIGIKELLAKVGSPDFSVEQIWGGLRRKNLSFSIIDRRQKNLFAAEYGGRKWED
jgi:hypothetical protein